MEEKEEFDKGCYGTQTTPAVLKIVENLKFKGYTYLSDRRGNKENFFIWKRTDKAHEYLRVTLMSEDNDNKLFYWNLETSFKPFAYKHNHRKNANIQSERFKASETDKYLNYFLNIVDRARVVLK